MQQTVERPALDAAISRYQGYLQADPDNPHLLVTLGELYQRCGKLDDAMACYERCVSNPGVAQVARCQIGKVWLSQRRYQDAERCFRALLEENGDDRTLSHHLGISLFHQRRWNEALAALDHARDAGLCSAENAAYRAQTLHQLGRLNCAIKACEKWLALEPSDAAHAYLALLLMATGELPQAHELAQYVLEREPTNADAALVEWVWCLEQHADERAQHLLSAAVKPESARGRLALALQRVQHYDAHTALPAVETALQHLAEDVDTTVTLGWAQLGSHHFLDAEHSFRSALQRDGNLAEAHIGAAIALLLQSPSSKSYYLLSTLKEMLDAVNRNPNECSNAAVSGILQHIQWRLREQAARASNLECHLH